ncbi:MAG: YbaN family protein [Defluviitaleaceae bacterium]|nr:YbaN family protein [Defluviitaleaceae bacterium]
MKKALLIAAGFVSLILGVAGIILPVLPTTPFVLLSASCFSMSNEKLEKWLLKSRVFGPFIDNYRTKRGISILHKTASIAFLWTGLITSMLLTAAVWAYILLPMVGVGVTVHLLMIKTAVNKSL